MLRGSAFLVFWCLAAPGCREQNGGTGPSVIPLVRPALSPGMSFVYEHWELDRYGIRIPNSNVRRVWRVIADSAQAMGYADVTVVVDSMVGRAVDTLLFRFLPSGDIYQYGFLATIIERWGDRVIPPRWDQIAAFSRGLSGGWTVGWVDSAARVTARGQTAGQQLLFEVPVDGVRTLFPGFRVEISAEDVECSYWISDAPSAFLRIREDVTFGSVNVSGELSEVREIRSR